jgi:hypothetical protein
MRKSSDAFNALPFEQRKILSGLTNEERIQSLRAIRLMVHDGHKATLARIDAWIANCEEQQKRDEAP